MPTSNDEAAKIVQISQEYLEFSKLQELMARLNTEIGPFTTNDSLKKSLAMMNSLVNPPPEPKISKWIWVALYLTVLIHFLLVVGIAASFLVFKPVYGSLVCLAALLRIYLVFRNQSSRL